MKKYNITVNGTTYAVEVEEVGGGSAAPKVAAPAAPAQVAAAPVATAAPAPAAAAPAAPAPEGATIISAPMPGTIWEVVAAPGQAVKSGDVLVILEAMKMENEIMAPYDAVVQSISVKKGDAVNTGDLLVTLV